MSTVRRAWPKRLMRRDAAPVATGSMAGHVDERAKGLQIESFACGIRGDHEANVALLDRLFDVLAVDRCTRVARKILLFPVPAYTATDSLGGLSSVRQRSTALCRNTG